MITWRRQVRFLQLAREVDLLAVNGAEELFDFRQRFRSSHLACEIEGPLQEERQESSLDEDDVM